tara:strand:- start:7655 stop:7963 length:309 start_codon:yes stop_codon:yes gene_type:complete
MKRLLFIISFLFISKVQSQSLKQQDKMLHLGATYVISSITSSIVYNSTHDRKKAFFYGLGASIAIGGFKEIYDIKHGDSNWDDMAANLVGGSMGSFIVILKF